jgi:integrase
MRKTHKLDAVFKAAAGAYSPATIRGYKADLHIFAKWCAPRKCSALPAKPAAVAEFVDAQIDAHCVSTIKRRVCAIAFAHAMLDLPLPTKGTAIRLALRRAARKKPSRPKQVAGLTNHIRTKVISCKCQSLAELRDATLISVGYDTLCRSSELAAMRIEHLDLHHGKILIPRSKSDTTGAGRIAYLSPTTAKLIKRWLSSTKIHNGPLFRSLHLGRLSDGPLSTSAIRRLVKRATGRSGIAPHTAVALSGHSMRIGAAQDMLVAGFDALAIMQAGGWKSANVVLRYIENAATKELHDRRRRELNAAVRSVGSRTFRL